MSGEPLINAATQWLRRAYERANLMETPPTNTPVTEDFLYVDRRTGGGFNNGSLDASDWRRLVTETWQVGAGRPMFSIREVVAVRGQWSAAVVELLDFGEGMSIEYINCFQLDSVSRLMRRSFDFDLNDRDAAVTELDRLHAEMAD